MMPEDPIQQMLSRRNREGPMPDHSTVVERLRAALKLYCAVNPFKQGDLVQARAGWPMNRGRYPLIVARALPKGDPDCVTLPATSAAEWTVGQSANVLTLGLADDGQTIVPRWIPHWMLEPWTGGDDGASV